MPSFGSQKAVATVADDLGSLRGSVPLEPDFGCLASTAPEAKELFSLLHSNLGTWTVALIVVQRFVRHSCTRRRTRRLLCGFRRANHYG